MIKTTIFTHRPRVSLARFSFCWWRHNRFLVTSQWPDNCDAITWIMISNSLDIVLFTAIFTAGCVRKRDCNHLHHQCKIMKYNVMCFYVPYKYFCTNDDAIKWKLFLRYWPFVWGCHRSPVNSTHKGQGRGALMFSLSCVWTNGCANNRDAGYLRRHRAHYNVTVMDNCYQVPLEWWSWETKHSFVFDATAAWAMASIK